MNKLEIIANITYLLRSGTRNPLRSDCVLDLVSILEKEGATDQLCGFTARLVRSASKKQMSATIVSFVLEEVYNHIRETRRNGAENAKQ